MESFLAAHASCHLEHCLFRVDRRVFEWRREWNGDMHCSHSPHRLVQIVESALCDDGRNLRRNSVPSISFIDHDRSRCFLYRVDQSFFIEWPSRARIDYFSADAVLLK